MELTNEEQLTEDFYEMVSDIPIDATKYPILTVEEQWKKAYPENPDDENLIYDIMDKNYLNPPTKYLELLPQMLEYEYDDQLNIYEDPELFPVFSAAQHGDNCTHAYLKVTPINGGWNVSRYLYDEGEVIYVSDMEYIYHTLFNIMQLEAQYVFEDKSWS